jgi:hypothetical protein
MRPFSVIEDNGFKTLMKTGRPEYYLPSRHTVARDVEKVFEKTHKKIAKMLQVCASKLLNSQVHINKTYLVLGI